MKTLIFLQVIHVFSIFVNGGSMTNVKAYQRFHYDKKVEEYWFTFNTKIIIMQDSCTGLHLTLG